MFLEEKLDVLKKKLSPKEFQVRYNDYKQVMSRIESRFLRFDNLNYHFSGWKERLKDFQSQKYEGVTFDFLYENLEPEQKYWWVFVEGHGRPTDRHWLFDANWKGGLHLSSLFSQTPIFIVDKKYEWMWMVEPTTKTLKKSAEPRRFPIISAKTTRLDRMQLKHAEAYAEIISDPETGHFITELGPITADEAAEKIRRNNKLIEEGKSLYWAIMDLQQNFLGYIAAHNLWEDQIAISYAIHPQFRRQGYATTALKLIMNWERFHHKELFLSTHLTNTASYQMLQKLGLSYQGVMRTRFGERHVFLRKIRKENR